MTLPSSHHLSDATPVASEIGVLDSTQLAGLRSQISRQLAGEGEEAIEDVLQEVAFAWNQAEGTVRENPGAWLRQVAAHKVQDYWRRVERRRRLRSRLTELSDTDAPQQPSPYEWVIALEESRDLHAALKRLPDEERTLLEDKYLREHSYEQLAVSRHISIKTIEYRLLRARQAIRQHLENRTP